MRSSSTKFDVTVGGHLHTRLPKRRAAYLVIRGLCDSGVSPLAIAEFALEDEGRRLKQVVTDLPLARTAQDGCCGRPIGIQRS